MREVLETLSTARGRRLKVLPYEIPYEASTPLLTEDSLDPCTLFHALLKKYFPSLRACYAHSGLERWAGTRLGTELL